MIRWFAAIRAGLAAVTVVAGVPVLMLLVGGNPLPHQLPAAEQVQAWTADPLARAYLPEVARTMAWMIWALIAWAMLGTCLRRVRRWRWARLAMYLPGPVQGLAATLLGAATVTAGVGGLPAHAAVPTTAGDSHGPDHHHGTATVPPAATAHHDSSSAHNTMTITVHRGDTLWDIAEHRLGDPPHGKHQHRDPNRWREIYTLNRGHRQTDGYALHDPDQIHTGWVLTLPATHPTQAHPHMGTPAPAGTSTSPHTAGPPAEPGDAHTAPHACTHTPAPATTAPAPAATTPTRITPPATDNPSTVASPAAGAPTASSSAQPKPAATESIAPHSGEHAVGVHDEAGVSLPSQGWVSLGLATLIAAVASLLSLQRRRRARLGFPIPTGIAAQLAPMPGHLAAINVAVSRPRGDDEQPPRAASTSVAAPVGLDAGGNEVSLFGLPVPGLALTGPGAEPAARALLAAVLATGVTGSAVLRPMVVTTAATLARLLPAGAALTGLDPDGTSFDGERLIVLEDASAAVTHAEEELIVRRRLLDTFDLDTITALNERTDHAEMQPPYVLIIDAVPRHAGRLHAVGAHGAALDVHPVVLGTLDGIPGIEVIGDGATTGKAAATGLARMSTLAADDLAAVLAMLANAAARPEPGHDIDLDPTPAQEPAPPPTLEPVPAQPSGLSAPVRLRVLGPVLVETASGPVATGMRSGSYLVLTSLAVNPGGRTLDQLAADLHPDTNPSTAGKRIRTDISTTRRVLRAASGLNEAMFVVYDPATGRYRLDAALIAVDLWQMLTAIEAAKTTDNDTQALALLREAVELYGGDFADGADQTWITDYATTYRHQILSVFARIAELLEADHPNQAVAALERALEFDPVNEELYQRVMRIHGRARRPDAVRRTLRRLEERLADLADAEPSQATRRVADRQLRPATASGGHR